LKKEEGGERGEGKKERGRRKRRRGFISHRTFLRIRLLKK
jgi:hypothetical protein